MAKILLVDDSAVSRKKLRMILEEANHEIIGEAGDGEIALKKFKELSPDLVTMDVTMPKIDGITALKDIIKVDPSAKVVMITSLGKGSTIFDALNEGAKNFITKPFSEKEVIETITDVLEQL